MNSLLPMMRELRKLERKRRDEGVTPLEYQRWHDLKDTLEANLAKHSRAPEGVERRKSSRIATRLLVEFQNKGELREAVIHNVSDGGLFVSTPFAPAIGEEFILCIRVGGSSRAIDIPCVTVSNNVGDDFSTQNLGMGVKFLHLTAKQRAAVEFLLASALTCEATDEEEADAEGT